jgi:prepilin-type N-terminal cleavage/methylation domain-containing protein
MRNKFDSDKAEKIASSSKNSQRGFTIVELMIAMIVFTIVTGAIWGLLRVSQRSRSLTNHQVHLTKNVRVALNVIGRDTYNAGYGYPAKDEKALLPDNRISALLAIPNDFDTTRDTVRPVIAGNDITLNTYTATPNTKTDQITFLFKDSTFNLVGTPGKEVSTALDIASLVSSGGVYTATLATGSVNSACRPNDIYLISGKNATIALGLATSLNGTNEIKFASSASLDVLGFNQTGTASPFNQVTVNAPAPPSSIATMQRVSMVSYFVTADGILTRREYANEPPNGSNPPRKWLDEPLVYGVENFQIKYVLDDGSVADNPIVGPDNLPGTADDLENLGRVRQVRYTITVRNVEKIETLNQDYRVTMSSAVSTRNLGYDAN